MYRFWVQDRMYRKWVHMTYSAQTEEMKILLSWLKNNRIEKELTMRDLNRKISAKELVGRLYGDDYKNGKEINTSEYKGYVATVEINTSFGDGHKCRVAILYKNKKEAFQFIATTKN